MSPNSHGDISERAGVLKTQRTGLGEELHIPQCQSYRVAFSPVALGTRLPRLLACSFQLAEGEEISPKMVDLKSAGLMGPSAPPCLPLGAAASSLKKNSSFGILAQKTETAYGVSWNCFRMNTVVDEFA